MMKKIVLATGLSLLASTAVLADGPGQAMMEPQVIREQTAASSSHDWVVLLLTAAVIAAVVSK